MKKTHACTDKYTGVCFFEIVIEQRLFDYNFYIFCVFAGFHRDDIHTICHI